MSYQRSYTVSHNHNPKSPENSLKIPKQLTPFHIHPIPINQHITPAYKSKNLPKVLMIRVKLLDANATK